MSTITSQEEYCLYGGTTPRPHLSGLQKKLGLKVKRKKEDLFDTITGYPLDTLKKNDYAARAVNKDRVKALITRDEGFQEAPEIAIPLPSVRTLHGHHTEFRRTQGPFSKFMEACILKDVNYKASGHDTTIN
jgi:hypothetical protein